MKSILLFLFLTLCNYSKIIAQENRNSLQKNESERLLLVRGFKTLILGDWKPESKRIQLLKVRNKLLDAGYYAATLD